MKRSSYFLLLLSCQAFCSEPDDYNPKKTQKLQQCLQDPAVSCTTIKKLLNQKADPRQKTPGTLTALQKAVAWKCIHLVRKCLARGSHGHEIDPENQSLISQTNNTSIIKLLIAAGADKEWQDEEGATDLHYRACDAEAYTDGADPIMILCSEGWDPNKVDNDGNTPMHDACSHRCPGMGLVFLNVAALYLMGADIGKKNKKEQTPRDLLPINEHGFPRDFDTTIAAAQEILTVQNTHRAACIMKHLKLPYLTSVVTDYSGNMPSTGDILARELTHLVPWWRVQRHPDAKRYSKPVILRNWVGTEQGFTVNTNRRSACLSFIESLLKPCQRLVQR